MTTRNDDDRTMTARNTVGIPCPVVDVPKRNIIGEEFLKQGGPLLEREVNYLRKAYGFSLSDFLKSDYFVQFGELNHRYRQQEINDFFQFPLICHSDLWYYHQLS